MHYQYSANIRTLVLNCNAVPVLSKATAPTMSPNRRTAVIGRMDIIIVFPFLIIATRKFLASKSGIIVVQRPISCIKLFPSGTVNVARTKRRVAAKNVNHFTNLFFTI